MSVCWSEKNLWRVAISFSASKCKCLEAFKTVEDSHWRLLRSGGEDGGGRQPEEGSDRLFSTLIGILDLKY